MTMQGPWRDSIAPSDDDIKSLVRSAWAALPEAVTKGEVSVNVQVEDLASAELLKYIGLHDPYALAACYRRSSPGLPGADGVSSGNGVVLVFREPLLDHWLVRGDITLGELVRKVLLDAVAGPLATT